MKFAQEFRKALQREAFPRRWVDCAIPYGQLKKCLKKVTKELEEIGLDKETLTRLAVHQQQPSSGDSNAPVDPGFKYQLAIDGRDDECGSGGESVHFRPKLTVFVKVEDGIAVDATLSPSTREFLQKLALSSTALTTDALPLADTSSVASTAPPSLTASSATDIRQVEVPLVFDAEFFGILQTDVSNIRTLEEEEQTKLEGQIVALGEELGHAVEPSRGRRARGDLEVWRQIFELYLDACIFFSSRESDHGARTSTQAVEQLHWFQDQVVQRKLVQRLRLDTSHNAFNNFVSINTALLSILKFQEINRLAVTKILKKFDKRTSLGVSNNFLFVARSDRSLANSVAQDVCARMSTELMSVVPQLDDYLCPICFAIAYWPVRLHCQHVFCSRCLVKMSRKGERHCPLCRADTIMLAGLENFDADRAAFLRKYFPKEVKEKVRANERERNQEIFGPSYRTVHCCMM
ncbi:RING-14 protein [Xylaria bambusicola]|uniref:RING-14 protein n=1 Tax=Xylaria bambusicola TaxID=326684 RepID=UPI0020071F13|nr:RING-14 protein [Xylaria bambusicola]KAI0517682.1 RING-14 protein [Xylaria bambusicola]